MTRLFILLAMLTGCYHCPEPPQPPPYQPPSQEAKACVERLASISPVTSSFSCDPGQIITFETHGNILFAFCRCS